MTKLIYFGKSKRWNKRFKAKFEEPDKRTVTVHFSTIGGKTYVDGVDPDVRDRYLKRHAVDLKTGDPLRAGFLAYYVTWGKSRNVEDNLKAYLKKFNITDAR